ncbi:putative ankyrin repeat protein RF_0381 [Cloeon dipterum]|uniref:putative ankyrin repeat protein RF_0381 n=1 Tax=Cloeon dipterum TaxID=197152 RepID=UPI0032205ACD
MASKEEKIEKQERIEMISSQSTMFNQLQNRFFDKNKGGATRLQFAASIADLETCQRLIGEGAAVDAKSEDLGATALHYAALNKNHGKELVTLFVSLGLQVTEMDSEGEEPIHYAIRMQNFKIAEHLLQLRDGGGNLLQLCVKQNRLLLAKLVHQYNEHLLESIGDFGESILFLAVRNADKDMCSWLVEEGADINALSGDSQASVFHYVGCNTSHGSEIACYLVSLGLDLSAQDRLQFTPLHYSLFNENIKVAVKLFDLGASLKEKIGDHNLLNFAVVQSKLLSAKFVHEMDKAQIKERSTNGKSIREIAAEFANLKTCEWLFGEGVDVLAETEQGKNVLHYAARNKKHGVELIRAFIALGVDMNKVGESMNTPLFEAIDNNNRAVAEVLLSLGADVRIKRRECNLLQSCIIRNNLAVAEIVHHLDAEQVKQLRPNGQTALHIAAFWADLKFCEWIVAEGVDINVLTNRGESALDFALRPESRDALLHGLVVYSQFR